MTKVFYGIIGVLLLITAFIFGCSNSDKEPETKNIPSSREFIIAGSGANLPITGKLIDRYNKKYGIKMQMPSSIGSSGGIKAVSEGAIDLGLASRLLQDEEMKSGLKQFPYARVGIVIGVNADVPDDNITYQDIVDIFGGKKNKWKNGKMIIVMSREKGDSTNQVLQEVVPGFKSVLEDSYKNARWQIYFTDSEEAEGIQKFSSSIGFTDTGALSVLSLKIKPLKVNGVIPSSANVVNGSYKLYKDFYFIYKEPIPERVARFMEFISSDEGQRIISSNGGIPLKGK